jgi:hypothetical protein
MSGTNDSDDIQKRKVNSSGPIAGKSTEENGMYIDNNVPVTVTSKTETKTYSNATADVRAETLMTTEDDKRGRSHLNTETSGKTTNDKDEAVKICLDSLGLIPHKIRLYALRSSKESNKFIIQAIFSSGKNLISNETKRSITRMIFALMCIILLWI